MCLCGLCLTPSPSPSLTRPELVLLPAESRTTQTTSTRRITENLLKIYCWGSIIKMNLNDQEVLLICMKLLNQRFCIIEGKVSDFGLAKLLGSGKSHITTRVMGTFGYVDHGSKLTTSAHGADQFRKADQITSRSSPHTSTQPTSASVGES